jgi:hypothetical protein
MAFDFLDSLPKYEKRSAIQMRDLQVNSSLIRHSQRDFTAKKRVREPDLCRFYLN